MGHVWKGWLTGGMVGAILGFGAVAQAEVRVGIAAPITGPSASFGAQLERGARQAVNDLNAQGGILGQKIELFVGDDVSDPKQGVSVANKFVGDRVTLVVGHFDSGVTIPATEVYAENGMLYIAPAATNPKVTERGLWDVFRVCGRDDQQARLWADYVKEKFAGKKIAIAHDKTTYGLGLAGAARGFLNADGVKEVLFEGVNRGEKDYSALISAIKARGADLFLWGGEQTEAGLMIRQMQEQGLKTVMMSGDALTSAEFATIGGDGVVGTLMSFGPDPRRNPAAQAIVAAFEAQNFEPEGYTLYSYAAIQIFAQAAEAVKSLDTRAMADVMHSGKVFRTVLGDISFDKKGDRTTVDYVMYTWRKGADGKVGYEQN